MGSEKLSYVSMVTQLIRDASQVCPAAWPGYEFRLEPAGGGSELRNDLEVEVMSCPLSMEEAWHTWRSADWVRMWFPPLSSWMVPMGVNESLIFISPSVKWAE